MIQKNEKRSGVITLRLRGPDRERVVAAAEHYDLPVSQFVRSAAVREARRIAARLAKKEQAA